MDGKDCDLSIRRQAELLGVNRSSFYRGSSNEESEENLAIMRFMDEGVQTWNCNHAAHQLSVDFWASGCMSAEMAVN